MRMLIACVALLTAALAFAVPMRTLEGAVMLYDFDYKEDVPAPLKSTENGTLVGGRLVYSIYDAKGLQWRALGEYTDDTTDYDGTDQVGNPILSTTDNTFLTLEGDVRIGTARVAGLTAPLVFYTGLGYRAWDRDLGGEGGYLEEYRWLYLPLGVRAEYPISARWSGSADLALRAMLDGSIRFFFSDVNPAYNNPEADLGNKVGVRLDLPFTYRTDDRWALVVTPWYEYSQIGESNRVELTTNGTSTGLFYYEPSSRTHQYGVNTGVRWTF